MRNNAKAVTLLLVILIILSLSLAGGAFYFLQKEKVNNKVLQERLTEVNLKYTLGEKELNKQKELVSLLELKVKESKNQLDTLTADLEQEKLAKKEAQGQTERLRIELEEQKKLKQGLEDKFNQTQEKIQSLEAQLKELDAQKTQLETKIENLQALSKDTVELGKITVTPEEKRPEDKTPAPALEGKVLVINKDYNFAVINLGLREGIEVGNVFSVYHDNKYIGEVEIEKVHDSMSAAGFLSQAIRNNIAEGDKVVLKSK